MRKLSIQNKTLGGKMNKNQLIFTIAISILLMGITLGAACDVDIILTVCTSFIASIISVLIFSIVIKKKDIKKELEEDENGIK